MVVQATPVNPSGGQPGHVVQAMPLGGGATHGTVIGQPVYGPGGEPMQSQMHRPSYGSGGDQMIVMSVHDCIDEPAPDPTCLAAVTCLCCFCPTGLFAVLKAQEVSRANAEGNFPLAHKKRKEAMIWIYVTFAIGFLIQILQTFLRGRTGGDGGGGGAQLLLL